MAQLSFGDVRIEQYPDARYYEDGTWPKDCQGYIGPADGYLYEGATGHRATLFDKTLME